ncbi:MAG: PQQ-dependent sugar dehydrogenase [Candidatus Limnocylindria bacterium]
MLKRRRNRLLLLVALIVAGVAAIWIGLGQNAQREAEAATPMDIEWDGDVGYASIGEGQLLRLTVDGDAVVTEVLADGLAYPRGLAVTEDTIYVAELVTLPCENPVPRCKGENVGAASIAEGELQILGSSSGRVLAFPRTADGLGMPQVLVDGLRFVNTDHGLNDIDLGPDGMLYLSVGNLDRLAWDSDVESPTGPETRLLGSILRIDPASGEVSQFASGLRNVFGIDFDQAGLLWGVDNDGPGRGPWRFEELLMLEDGMDYGFPTDGTVGPYERRTGFATWIMPVGAGSSGLLVRDDVILSGGCGRVTWVDLKTTSGDALVREIPNPGCVTAIERMPDGRLVLGTVFAGTPFRVTTEDELLDR